ncbi:MAG TPA: glycoside hydrolase family 30 protein [Polyangiaceae bacterium]|nr:glycoside hydrolase family 30 protein [Polyangiaceae bacterium]
MFLSVLTANSRMLGATRVGRPVRLSGLVLSLAVVSCSSNSSAPHGSGGSSGTGASTAGGSATAAGGAPGSGGSAAHAGAGGSSTSAGAGGSSTSGGSAGAPGAAGMSAGGSVSSGGQSASAGMTSALAGGAGQSGVGGGAAGTGGSGAGGQTGSAGSGASGAPTLPEFVTSAPNDYWNTMGKVTTLTSGTPTLTVDASTKYQQFTGFGGCFNEMSWDALSVLSADDVTKAMKLLFDANDGANFVYGRIPMGASDYAMSWYTLDDTAGDYAMNDFSIARDEQKLIPYIKAALAIRPDIRLWASPWVVPSWMMDSSSNMKSDAQTLGAHALYMSRFVEDYAKDGITIWAVHPQNEPGYAKVHWTQAELIDFMKTYLGPTFAKENLTTEVWCGTMSKDPDDTNIAEAAAMDADAMKVIKGFGVQWNLEAAVPTLAAKGPVMQTEHRCGNYPFMSPYWDESRYSSSMPQNDHAYGEESWQLIRDWIVAGVNSYSAWNMVLDTVGKSLDGWPQDALLTVDRSAKKLIVTPAYYAFRHYSQYIQPGATRISLTGSTDALAFANPDGSIVTEVFNSGMSTLTTSVGIGASTYQFDVPGQGWATLLTPP